MDDWSVAHFCRYSVLWALGEDWRWMCFCYFCPVKYPSTHFPYQLHTNKMLYLFCTSEIYCFSSPSTHPLCLYMFTQCTELVQSVETSHFQIPRTLQYTDAAAGYHSWPGCRMQGIWARGWLIYSIKLNIFKAHIFYDNKLILSMVHFTLET